MSCQWKDAALISLWDGRGEGGRGVQGGGGGGGGGRVMHDSRGTDERGGGGGRRERYGAVGMATEVASDVFIRSRTVPTCWRAAASPKNTEVRVHHG